MIFIIYICLSIVSLTKQVKITKGNMRKQSGLSSQLGDGYMSIDDELFANYFDVYAQKPSEPTVTDALIKDRIYNEMHLIENYNSTNSTTSNHDDLILKIQENQLDQQTLDALKNIQKPVEGISFIWLLNVDSLNDSNVNIDSIAKENNISIETIHQNQILQKQANQLEKNLDQSSEISNIQENQLDDETFKALKIIQKPVDGVNVDLKIEKNKNFLF